MPDCLDCGPVKGEMRKRVKQITETKSKEDEVFCCEKCGQEIKK